MRFTHSEHLLIGLWARLSFQSCFQSDLLSNALTYMLPCLLIDCDLDQVASHEMFWQDSKVPIFLTFAALLCLEFNSYLRKGKKQPQETYVAYSIMQTLPVL